MMNKNRKGNSACNESLKVLRKLETGLAVHSEENISTTDEPYLKVMSSKNKKKLTKDLRDSSGPSVDPSTAHCHIRNSLCEKVAVNNPFLRKGNRRRG